MLVGRDDSHVDRLLIAPPRRLNFCSCSTRSSFTCVAGVISRFRRGTRPAVRELEAALRRSARSGERAFLVAEISLFRAASPNGAQLIATNENAARGLELMDGLATSSFRARFAVMSTDAPSEPAVRSPC